MLWILISIGVFFVVVVGLVLNERRVSQLKLKSAIAYRDLSEKDKLCEQLNQKLITTEIELKESNKIQLEQAQKISKLTSELNHEIKRIEDLKSAKEELSQQFKVVAQEVLEQKSKVHKESLDIMLEPFKQQVKGFAEKIESYHTQGKADQAALRTSLQVEVRNMMDLSQKIKSDADNLAKALKGDKKIQGNWGELVLERVLETSGLRQGIEYTLQKSLKNNEDQIFRPDVIVHLPEKKDVIIDSKVSLVAYERFTRFTDQSEQTLALKQHIQSVKTHIDQLSEKDYSQLKDVQSLDFVLLFIPIEAAFVVAFQNDEKLFSYAFNKRIIVVTPTTLLATLRTIENIWRYERQNQNAQQIAQRAKLMLDKFHGFVKDLDTMGAQISKLKDMHEQSLNKLSKGRGNLVSQAVKLVDLGVPVSKDMPKGVLHQADLDDRR